MEPKYEEKYEEDARLEYIDNLNLREMITQLKTGNDNLLEDILFMLSMIWEEDIDNVDNIKRYDTIGVHIGNYKSCLTHLLNRFDKWAIQNSRKNQVITKNDEIGVARSLFDYFWQDKSDRSYDGGGVFLDNALSSQISRDCKNVGNCYDLTSLFSVACIRKGIGNLKIAYGHYLDGNHIMNCLDDIYIENTSPTGFNIKDEYYANFNREDLIGLIAGAYINKAAVFKERHNKLGEKMDREVIIKFYNKALETSPRNSVAIAGRGYQKEELGDLEGALEDYSKAIEFNPRFVTAYESRGALRRVLGNYQGANEDDKIARKLRHFNHLVGLNITLP